MLQEEAHLVAARMGHLEFRASNGWLQSFKNRHNIRQFTVVGRLLMCSKHEIILMDGLKPEDIWNTDETGCFY